MRESRLFKIIYYLLDKGMATAAELAERFEVSVRTIYRDIDALSSAGIPIYTEMGRGGGIRLLSDFVMDQTVISEQEKREILSALRGMEMVSGSSDKDMIEKLSALFRVRAVDWLDVDFSRWGDKPRDNERFTVLKSAILQNRCVMIMYADSFGRTDERVIQPLQLFYKSKDWYLKAYCRLKKDFRLFKLNRILAWEILEESFVPMEVPEFDDAHGQPSTRVILRFPKEMAYRVYDEFDIDQIRSEDNGDMVVTAKMPEDAWLTGYLLSFGTQVEIVEPAYLRGIIAAEAKRIYDKNKI